MRRSARRLWAVLLWMVVMGNAWGAGGQTALLFRDGCLWLERGSVSFPVTLSAPRLEFSDAVLEAVPLSISETDLRKLQKGIAVVVPAPARMLPDGKTLETELVIQWRPDESLLEKKVRLKASVQTPVLREVELERRDVTGLAADRGDVVQSQPVFFPGGFCGVAFPIASTRVQGGQLVLAQNPGLSVAPGQWWESHTAVFHACDSGKERQAFRSYLQQRRVASPSFHVNYNSWWTSPVPYAEKDILDLMGVFEDKLYRPHRAKLDTFCIDMGWSNARSLWEIDPALFPQGFSMIEKAAHAMGSQLGLWISPSSCYPPALDCAWAKDNGYEADPPCICLGGTRYATAFRDRLADHVGRYHIGHLKFDGYRATCQQTDHGHEPGRLSADPIAYGMLAAAAAVHAANRDAWIETTCFGADPSPWWLCYFNSVIGSFGDDAPSGRAPAPVYRESYTTARDYYNLQGLAWNPVPPQMQEILGLVHQTQEPFMNDAVMTVMRGHQFLPLYLNPKYMDDARWRKLAQVLKWARKQVPRMVETIALFPASWQDGRCPRFDPSAPMPREAYGYVQRLKGRVLVALRNPWIAAQTYALPLTGEYGFNEKNKPLHAVSVYPEPRLYGKNLRTGDTLQVPLAPYETVVLEISDAKPTLDTPPPGPGSIRVSGQKSELRRVRYTGEPFGADFTSPVGNVTEELQWSLCATADVDTPEAQWVLLCEGIDDARVVAADVNGKPVTFAKTGSDTGWKSTGLPLPERWVLLTTPVPPGANALRATLACSAPEAKVSAWIWGTRSEPAGVAALPSPERISLESQVVVQPKAVSGDMPLLEEPRPVERIDGVFLDALEPERVSVGFGELQRNKAILGGALRLGDTTWPRGLAVHANGVVAYRLNKAYRRFQAWVGADAATYPTIVFEVWVDGAKRWESGLMRREDAAKRIDIDVSAADLLEIRVGDAGNGISADHGDWVDARLLK